MSERKKRTEWTFDGQSVLDANGKSVCTKANGHLIAALPELVEALRSFVAAMPTGGEGWGLNEGEYELWSKARAALARAGVEVRS